MHSLSRAARLPVRILRPVPLVSSTPRRNASESYGGSQSGQQEANKDTPNPKADLEHSGPKAPADKGTTQSGQPQSSGSQSGRPAIHQPGPAPENKNAEVEAHNKEMEQRSDRTVNQLYEEDNKVDKNFWKGAKSSPMLAHVPPFMFPCLVLIHRPSLLTSVMLYQQEMLSRRQERNKISDKSLALARQNLEGRERKLSNVVRC